MEALIGDPTYLHSPFRALLDHPEREGIRAALARENLLGLRNSMLPWKPAGPLPSFTDTYGMLANLPAMYAMNPANRAHMWAQWGSAGLSHHLGLLCAASAGSSQPFRPTLSSASSEGYGVHRYMPYFYGAKKDSNDKDSSTSHTSFR